MTDSPAHQLTSSTAAHQLSNSVAQEKLSKSEAQQQVFNSATQQVRSSAVALQLNNSATQQLLSSKDHQPKGSPGEEPTRSSLPKAAPKLPSSPTQHTTVKKTGWRGWVRLPQVTIKLPSGDGQVFPQGTVRSSLRGRSSFPSGGG